MSDPKPQLKDLLSYELTGEPYDSSSVHREKFLVDHLTEKVGDWEVGDLSFDELQAAFGQHDLGQFDFLLWMQSKADEGIYEIPSEEDQETD